MEFLTLNQGGHTSNAIPKDRWPTVGLFGGTIEPLGCDVLFKDRMCFNLCLFGDVCLKDVEKLSFLWMNFYDEDVFSECFTRFFGWLRRNIVIFNVKRIVPGWNSDQPAGEKSGKIPSQVMCGYTSKKWTLPKILGIRIKQKVLFDPFIPFFDPYLFFWSLVIFCRQR